MLFAAQRKSTSHMWEKHPNLDLSLGGVFFFLKKYWVKHEPAFQRSISHHKVNTEFVWNSPIYVSVSKGSLPGGIRTSGGGVGLKTVDPAEETRGRQTLGRHTELTRSTFIHTVCLHQDRNMPLTVPAVNIMLSRFTCFSFCLKVKAGVFTRYTWTDRGLLLCDRVRRLLLKINSV